MASLLTLSADDRDGVRSNLTQLGAQGALSWAAKRLAAESGTLRPSVRRMLILTIMEAARELERDVRSARRLARCHAAGLRQQQAKKRESACR